MMFITLAADAVFDATDNQGRILDRRSGKSFALDPIATILLQTGLCAPSKEEAIATIREQVEATDQQVAEGFESLLRDLMALDLLSSSGQMLEAPALAPTFRSECARGMTTHALVPDDSLWEICRKQHIPHGKRLDWEFFSTGRFLNAPLPQIPLVARGYALWKTSNLLWKVGVFRFVASFLHLFLGSKQLQDLQTREWQMLCRALAIPQKHSPLWRWRGEVEVSERLARRELTYCQCLTRLLAPRAMCLVRSAAFTYYLRTLGFPAHLMIGRARFQFSACFAFHSWVELDGRIVNDKEELETGYALLYRLPVGDDLSNLL